MTAALGIDCGGTATRWLLVDDAERKIASGEAPGTTGHVFAEAARDHTSAVLRDICAAVVAHTTPVSVTAGVTGLSNTSKEAIVIRDWLAADLSVSPDRVSVVDDMWIAFHTAFAPGTGIIVYGGTGAVGCHVDTSGTLQKTGAHGHIIDDGGSAYWIGQRAIRWLMRTWDEQGAPPATPLADELYACMGGPDWELIREFIYKEARSQVVKLARPVAGAANRDDREARQILADAGAELARLANVLARRVGPRPVALIGGTALLHPTIRRSFIEHLDDRTVTKTSNGEPDLRDAVRTPVEAAAKLALARAAT